MEIAIEHGEVCNVSFARKGVVEWELIHYPQAGGDAFESFKTEK